MILTANKTICGQRTIWKKIREEEIGIAFYSSQVITFSAEECLKGCMCAQPHTHAHTPTLPDAILKSF